MNEIMNVTNQTPIEIALGVDEKGMTTARKLYEFLELNPSNYSKWLKRNITENEFAVEDEDFHSYQMTSEGRGNYADDYKLTSDFAKKLSMTAKNEKGEEARNYFVKVETKAKEMMEKQSQQPKSMEDIMIYQLQEIKRLKEQTQQATTIANEVKNDLQGIRDVVALDTVSWRDETGKLIRKIGNALDGGSSYQEIQREVYQLLEKRMGVNLKQRLTNKRRRMADEGICKSKRDKLNNLDIIQEDKKLIEGYVAIVKEMAIKYGVA